MLNPNIELMSFDLRQSIFQQMLSNSLLNYYRLLFSFQIILQQPCNHSLKLLQLPAQTSKLKSFLIIKNIALFIIYQFFKLFMLINSLSKTINQHIKFLIKFTFARKTKSTTTSTSIKQPQLSDTITQSEASGIKWYNKRQQTILKGNRRAIREEDEDLERQIIRLMDQNKTDQQIIQELSKRNQKMNPKQKSKQQQSMIQEQPDLFQYMGLTKRSKVQEQMSYKQMMMLEHIKNQSKEQAKARVGSKKQKSEPKYQHDQNKSHIPNEFLEDAENFKNKQLKYLSELVQRKKEPGKYMNQRRQKRYQRKQKQIIPLTNNNTSPDVMGVVPIQSKSQAINRLANNYLQSELFKNDSEFVKKGELDLQKSQKNSNLYLRENDIKEMSQYRPFNSHVVQQKRINSFAKMLKQQNFVMDMESIAKIQKQTLMESKKNLQELQLFRKRLERRQRIKKMKEVYKKMNSQQLSDKHQAKDLYAPLDFDIKKHKLNFGVPNFQKINEINKNYARSIFSAESKKYSHLENRTTHNIKQWIWYQMIDGSTNRISPILDRIIISDMYLNEANTTVTIRWRFGDRTKPLQKVEIPDKQNQIIKNQQILNSMSQYLSGKMCQDLKLRFGPLIRFKYYELNQSAVDAKQQMLLQMPYIIKNKIKQELDKGQIPPKMTQKNLNKLLNTMESSYEQKIDNINFNTAADQENENENAKKNVKKQRDNRNPDGSRKKKAKRINPADQFWNQL